jgi:hypothetical protein
MPHTIEKTVWTFDELSDEAKERARNRWRENHLEYEWWDACYDDFERVAECLGIEFDYRGGKNWKGEPVRGQPRIYFSGFCSQGDGACFEGTWSFRKGWRKALKEHAPKDKELLEIGLTLSSCARTFFYRCSARVKHSGYYSHEYCTNIEVCVNDSRGYKIPAPESVDSAIADALRDFMRWMYKRLEEEYDYQMADEQIDESIRCNEVTFDEEGRVSN